MAKFILSGWNVPKIASYGAVKENTKVVVDLCQSVLSASKNTEDSVKSFDEMLQKAGVSEADLQKKTKGLIIFIRIYLIVGMLLLSYSAYLFGHALGLAGMVTVIFSVLMFSYAFREHMSLLRLRNRRLDITGLQWVKAIFTKK
jgi:intracellular multiplication protein IcmV